MSHISEQVFTAKCKHVAPVLAVGIFKIDQLVLGRCGTLPPTRTCDKTDAWGQLTHTHTRQQFSTVVPRVCMYRAGYWRRYDNNGEPHNEDPDR